MPIIYANAVTAVNAGAHTPMLARTVPPASGIRPTKIRSTMLYSKLKNWPNIAGIPSRRISFQTGVFSNNSSVVSYLSIIVRFYQKIPFYLISAISYLNRMRRQIFLYFIRRFIIIFLFILHSFLYKFFNFLFRNAI